VPLSISLANSSTRGKTGNSFTLLKPSSHCDVWKYFSCRIVDFWNSLFHAVVKSPSVASFNKKAQLTLTR